MIIITDLDGTLAQAKWRGYMRDEGWDVYWGASKDDKPNAAMVELINALLASHNTIICVTSRPEKWRQLTVQWLMKHQISIDQLIMRPATDYRPSAELKTSLVKELALAKHHIIAIDDRSDVLAAYQKLGFTTLLTEEV